MSGGAALESANIVIIGAGVIGLAVAAKISEKNEEVYLLERYPRYGQETSSHNSGVIHSGIHYPKNTLKATLCVRGNRILYDLCTKYHIPFKKLGKLTVAVTESEIDELQELMRMGIDNGVEDLSMLDRDQVKELEPNVDVEKALLTPSTGILEPDELMNHFHAQLRNNNGVLVTQTEVTGIRKLKESYEIGGTSVGEKFQMTAKVVINCAGLYSDKIAALAGLDIDKLGYRIHPCKGDYFRVSGKPIAKMLIYPVPKGPGLGIHLTPDLAGSVRLGPNAYYFDKIAYNFESEERGFREDVARFVPNIREHEINPDSSGIRPKLQGPNDSFRDFVIRHEADRDLPGFIDLIGIESPGLTAAPAIAESISRILENEMERR